jgi:aerobactin synthase
LNNWQQVNLNLIAKAIGEMVFEETLIVSESESLFTFTTSAGVSYSFQGQKSLWNWIKVDPNSITRNGSSQLEASLFFIDTQEYTQMSDITLAQFIEEMRSTLFADLKLLQGPSINEFIKLNYLESQQSLNGHPKILMNKGRIGWDSNDWRKYAPENKELFPLRLIAIKTSFLKGVLPQNKHYESLTSSEHIESIKKQIDLSLFTLMPVHPWQWENIILYQFQKEIHEGNLIDLGLTKNHFSPQVSLRTLNSVFPETAFEIKLPLSILNTSCIRGVPAKTIELGSLISKALTALIAQDEFLKEKVDILNEEAGVTYIPEDLAMIKGAPYRFHEYLGAIWRESADSKISPDGQIILTANLLYQDNHGKSAAAAYIRKSGLSAKEWLTAYTQVVILPLLHLQHQHGIGLVSHGQNIMLIMENYRPKKLVLKDFQGDFRFSNKAPQNTIELFGEAYQKITKLKPEHLIHDLYTAHFVTLLRYVGMSLSLENVISEKDFYTTISQEVSSYENSYGGEISLLKQHFEKILVNSVRFKIGYGDSMERPLPLLGQQILNPLSPVNL